MRRSTTFASPTPRGRLRAASRWFYIAANDAQSKLAFRLLQMLVNMYLVEGSPPTMPTLTIPVGR